MPYRSTAYVLCVVLCAAVLVGCCGLLNPASRLYGKWKLNIDATIDRNTGGNEFQAGLARAAWSLVGGDVTVEFRSDGTGAFSGRIVNASSGSLSGGGTEEGTWSLTSAEGDSFVVKLESDSGQTGEVTILLTDPDTFEVTGDDGNVFIFRRMTE